MSDRRSDGDSFSPWEQREVEAAARAARAIGGRAGDEQLDPAQRPLVEAGEGVAEGFELAEDDLIAAAEHNDGGGDPLVDAFPPEEEATAEGGEADHEDSSEVVESDR